MREAYWQEGGHKRQLRKCYIEGILLHPLLFAVGVFLAFGKTDFSFSAPRSKLHLRGRRAAQNSRFPDKTRQPAGFVVLLGS
jgi:hypothetical protein